MTYETMDWEAEARRIAWAFEVKTECKFRQKIKSYGEKRILLSCGRNNVAIDENWNLYATYKPGGMWFRMEHSAFLTGVGWVSSGAMWVSLDWNRKVLDAGPDHEYSELLVRALFRLDLLTQEIETALESSVTAHQKLEWQLEYEARLKATE